MQYYRSQNQQQNNQYSSEQEDDEVDDNGSIFSLKDLEQNKLIEIESDDDNQYEIKDIIDKSKWDKHRKRYLYHDKIPRSYPMFLISWKGYDSNSNSWEILENLRGCILSVEKYEGENRMREAKHALKFLNKQKQQRKKNPNISNLNYENSCSQYYSQQYGMDSIFRLQNRIQLPPDAKVYKKKINYYTKENMYEIDVITNNINYSRKNKQKQWVNYNQLDYQGKKIVDNQYEKFYQVLKDKTVENELRLAHRYFNSVRIEETEFLNKIQTEYQYFNPSNLGRRQENQSLYDFQQQIREDDILHVLNKSSELELSEYKVLIIPLEFDIPPVFLNVAANFAQQMVAPVQVEICDYNDIGKIDVKTLKINETIGKISYGGDEICDIISNFVDTQLQNKENILRVIGIMKSDIRDENDPKNEYSISFTQSNKPYTVFSLARFIHIIFKPDFLFHAERQIQKKQEKFEQLSDQLNQEREIEKRFEILENNLIMEEKCYITDEWVTHIHQQDLKITQGSIIQKALPFFISVLLQDCMNFKECTYKECCLNPCETCEDEITLNLLPCPLCVIKMKAVLKFQVGNFYKRVFSVLQKKHKQFNLGLDTILDQLKGHISRENICPKLQSTMRIPQYSDEYYNQNNKNNLFQEQIQQQNEIQQVQQVEEEQEEFQDQFQQKQTQLKQEHHVVQEQQQLQLQEQEENEDFFQNSEEEMVDEEIISQKTNKINTRRQVQLTENERNLIKIQKEIFQCQQKSNEQLEQQEIDQNNQIEEEQQEEEKEEKFQQLQLEREQKIQQKYQKNRDILDSYQQQNKNNHYSLEYNEYEQQNSQYMHKNIDNSQKLIRKNCASKLISKKAPCNNNNLRQTDKIGKKDKKQKENPYKNKKLNQDQELHLKMLKKSSNYRKMIQKQLEQLEENEKSVIKFYDTNQINSLIENNNNQKSQMPNEEITKEEAWLNKIQQEYTRAYIEKQNNNMKF